MCCTADACLPLLLHLQAIDKDTKPPASHIGHRRTTYLATTVSHPQTVLYTCASCCARCQLGALACSAQADASTQPYTIVHRLTSTRCTYTLHHSQTDGQLPQIIAHQRLLAVAAAASAVLLQQAGRCQPCTASSLHIACASPASARHLLT
jgi:hypothetical protein